VEEGERQMCLAVPGKVLSIDERDEPRMAKVDFGGVVKDVCLAYLPEIGVGDYTIVHVGFAIQKLDETSALETLALFESLGLLEEELGVDTGADAGPAPISGVDGTRS
jgi:hydrogenase expression/formation protein HypC